MLDSSNNSSPYSSPANISDNLDWFAFQYLSNELSEQESLDFEELLAQNQAAREALATAVQLIAGLKSIEPTPALNSQPAATIPAAFKPRTILSSRTQQGALISCAVAVLLVTSFLLTESSFRGTTNSQTVQTEPSQDDLKHLLDLWSKSAEESSFTVSLSSAPEQTDLEQTDLMDQQNVMAENHALEIPDWLFTAVSLPEESVN